MAVWQTHAIKQTGMGRMLGESRDNVVLYQPLEAFHHVWGEC